MSDNWKPLAYLIIVTFVITLFLGVILSGFVDTSQVNPEAQGGVTDSLVKYTSGGFEYDVNASIFGVNFILPLPNFYALLPNFAQQYFVSQFITLSYVPNWLLIFLSVLWVGALIWTLIALIKPGSS